MSGVGDRPLPAVAAASAPAARPAVVPDPPPTDHTGQVEDENQTSPFLGHEFTVGLTFATAFDRTASGDQRAGPTYGVRLERGGNNFIDLGAFRASTVTSVQGNFGDATQATLGFGVRAELGTARAHVYYGASVTGNVTSAPEGFSAGLGYRQSVGLRAGPIYGEVTRDNGTNVGTVGGSAGVRLEF